MKQIFSDKIQPPLMLLLYNAIEPKIYVKFSHVEKVKDS